MDTFKIVFTGGPCAGKTTLIELTKKYLKEKGYDVLVVPESATILKSIGFNFEKVGSVFDFQDAIFKSQTFYEDLAKQTPRNNLNKLIILFDRGILDNKSYCDDSKTFDNILKKHNGFEIDYLDDYDMVLNLISLAVCAPEKYNLSSNDQRSETPEEAAILDQKTSNAWAGHRNLKIINSNITVEESFEKVKKYIFNLIEKYDEKHITKLYLDNNLKDFKDYNDDNSRLIKIQKINLNTNNDDKNFVLYKRTYKDKSTYILQVYKDLYDSKIVYFDKKISFEEYLEFISKYNVRDIEYYNQLSFIINKQLFEIKFYDDETILEYEENKLNEKLVVPRGLNIIKEKTLLKVKKNDNIK